MLRIFLKDNGKCYRLFRNARENVARNARENVIGSLENTYHVWSQSKPIVTICLLVKTNIHLSFLQFVKIYSCNYMLMLVFA
jgi:hypothetical protein